MYVIGKETRAQGIELAIPTEGVVKQSSKKPNVMYSKNKQTWGGATGVMPEAATDNGTFFFIKIAIFAPPLRF